MKNLLPPLALAGAVCAAYANSLGGAFHFDDFNVILGSPVVHSWGAWLADAPSGIRPLLKLSYLLNWTLGAGVLGFHLLNLAVHLATSLLVYCLARRFLGKEPDGVSRSVALTASLLFALHPVQTEAVSYLSGRSASLMAAFYLAGLLAYDRGGEKEKARWLRVLLSPLLFLLAALVKETALTFPLALLLWDRARNPQGAWKETLRRGAAHWGLLAALCAGFWAHQGYGKFIHFTLQIRGAAENLLSQVNGVFYLLSKLFFLQPLNLDPDLPVLSQWSPALLAKAVLLAALLGTGLLAFKKRPALGFGILWFFLHLLPTNSVVPRLDIANDRHLYLPSLGIFLAAAAEAGRVRRAWPLRPALLQGAMGTLILALLLLTAGRNSVYRDEIALWEDTARKSPRKARVHNNLGYAYYLSGRYEEAHRAYREALRLKPDFSLAGNNLDLLRKTLAPGGGSPIPPVH